MLKQLALSLFAAAVPALAQCHFPPDGAGRILTYTFAPTVTATGTLLHVTLEFHGGPEANEEIEVPSEYAGEPLHGVINLHALSADTVVVDTNSPGSKLVRHPPDRDVVLEYDVAKDWTGRFRSPAQFHAVIMPGYIEVNGDNALVHPRLPAQTQVSVHFDWEKLPAG